MKDLQPGLLEDEMWRKLSAEDYDLFWFQENSIVTKNASLTCSGNLDKICKDGNSGGNSELSHLEFTFHKDLSWKENKTSGV